jgi:hypothetical protein
MLNFIQNPTVMLRCILVSLSVLFSSLAFSQSDDLREFNERKDQIGKRSMYALGGWAVGNFAVSGAMLGSATGADRHFHEMNIYWNVVNIGLATVGLLGSRKGHGDRNLLATINAQHSTEKIYLLNAGLDVGYIMGGFYLTELANRFPDRKDQFTGWGYSIAFQGGFLLVLDAVMFFIYKGQRNKKLNPILENIDVGLTGFRMRF